MKSWTGKDSLLPDCPNAPVDVLDMTFHAGRIKRFGVSGRHHYEWDARAHALLVTFIWVKFGFRRDQVIYATIHDMHEAVMQVDVPGPLKEMIGREHIKPIEDHVDGRLYQYFGLEPPTNEIKANVKWCDWLALIVEGFHFGSPGLPAFRCSVLPSWRSSTIWLPSSSIKRTSSVIGCAEC